MLVHHLYSWGANSHGQLGHGDTKEEEFLLPREVDLSSTDLDPENITKIVGGGGHTLILEKSGTVYSCGWNDKGQAGTQEESRVFKKLESLEGQKIVDIACGWNSSMAFTENGELFAWGSNSHGQLGLKNVPVGGKTHEPTKVEIAPVQKVAMGLRHTAVVTRDSKVFTCGASTKGQLGTKFRDVRYFDTFREVPGLQNVIEISCGQHHTIAGTKFAIFGWGENRYGQLGSDPKTRTLSLTPIRVSNLTNDFKSIHCGWTHTAVLTSKHKIFSCGRNSYGQLGYADSESKTEKSAFKFELGKRKLNSPALDSPVKLDTAIKIQQLAIGSEHNVALTDTGIVLSWGWNEHGNCGNGTSKNVYEPSKVSLPNTSGILIGTGAGHSFAVIKAVTEQKD